MGRQWRLHPLSLPRPTGALRRWRAPDRPPAGPKRQRARVARRHLLTGQVISQPHLMGLKLTSLFSVPRELAAWGRWHATASHRRHAARARLRAAWLLWQAYGKPCRTLRCLSAPNKSQDLGASAVFGKVGGENRAWRKDRTANYNFLAQNQVREATIPVYGSIFSVCASHSPPLEYLIVTISP